MSKCSHLRIGQSGEEGDHRVHHVLIVNDTVLTLADQNANKLAEVVTELLPHGPWHGEWIIPTVLLAQMAFTSNFVFLYALALNKRCYELPMQAPKYPFDPHYSVENWNYQFQDRNIT